MNFILLCVTAKNFIMTDREFVIYIISVNGRWRCSANISFLSYYSYGENTFPSPQANFIEKSTSKEVLFDGVPDRIRTCGLKSRSLALYPAGLRAHKNKSGYSSSYEKMVTHRGVEPLISPWEGDVLTTWPMGHASLRILF